MPQKPAPPSITEKAFSCPHCGAFSTQYWFDLYAKKVETDSKTPYIVGPEILSNVEANEDLSQERKKEFLQWWRKAMEGKVFVEGGGTRYDAQTVTNIHLSKCFACDGVAIWVRR